jgi:hypothetical protein
MLERPDLVLQPSFPFSDTFVQEITQLSDTMTLALLSLRDTFLLLHRRNEPLIWKRHTKYDLRGQISLESHIKESHILAGFAKSDEKKKKVEVKVR